MIEELNHVKLIELARVVALFPRIEGNPEFNDKLNELKRRLDTFDDSEKNPLVSYFDLDEGNYFFNSSEEYLRGLDVKNRQDIDFAEAAGLDFLKGIKSCLKLLILGEGVLDNNIEVAFSLLSKLSPENVPTICAYLESVLDESDLFFTYSSLLAGIKSKKVIDESKLKSSLQLLAFYLRSDEVASSASCGIISDALETLNLSRGKNDIAIDVLRRACAYNYNTKFIEGDKDLFLDFLDQVTEEKKSKLKDSEVKNCLLSLKRDADYSAASIPEDVQVEVFNDSKDFSEYEPLLPGEPKNSALISKPTSFRNFIFAAQAFYAVVTPVVFCLSIYFVAFDFSLIINCLSASAVFLAIASLSSTKDQGDYYKSSSMLVYSALVLEVVRYSSFLIFLLGGGALVSAGVYTGLSLLMLASFSIFFGSKGDANYEIESGCVPNPIPRSSGGMAVDSKQELPLNPGVGNKPTL